MIKIVLFATTYELMLILLLRLLVVRIMNSVYERLFFGEHEKVVYLDPIYFLH